MDSPIRPQAPLRLLLLAAALWLLSGIYVVRVDEQATVRRFGRAVANRVGPGIHVSLPFGIDHIDRFKPLEQKRLNVGFELPDAALGRPVNPAAREYLTGDENLVNVQLTVQYIIVEPRQYLFASQDLPGLLTAATESAAARALAVRGVDAVLTVDRLQVQNDIRTSLQSFVDRHALGISVTGIIIDLIAPPVAVADAFRDVSSAREDRDRLVHEAESYASSTIPAALADADRMQQEARGYRTGKVLEARGDADRFLRSYRAYKASPDVTRTRLYLEAVEAILPKLKVLSVDRDGGRTPVDINLFSRNGGSSTPGANGSSASGTPAGSIAGGTPAASGSVDSSSAAAQASAPGQPAPGNSGSDATGGPMTPAR